MHFKKIAVLYLKNIFLKKNKKINFYKKKIKFIKTIFFHIAFFLAKNIAFMFLYYNKIFLYFFN